jgi:hypothetical protein
MVGHTHNGPTNGCETRKKGARRKCSGPAFLQVGLLKKKGKKKQASNNPPTHDLPTRHHFLVLLKQLLATAIAGMLLGSLALRRCP